MAASRPSKSIEQLLDLASSAAPRMAASKGISQRCTILLAVLLLPILWPLSSLLDGTSNQVWTTPPTRDGQSVSQALAVPCKPGAGVKEVELAPVVKPTSSPKRQAIECKKQVWLACMAKTEDTVTSYDRHYMVALKSQQAKAPSLQPIVMYHGNPTWMSRWLENEGVVVVYHNLSFEAEMLELSGQVQDWFPAYFSKWLATFLWVDAPLIWDDIRASPLAETVDLDYVLYTDVDVMFRADVNSCTLPKPNVFSMGAEVNQGGVGENAGVIYINMQTFDKTMLEELLSWSRSKRYEFHVVDQDMVRGFSKISPGLITPLPDPFNWKPYWGSPRKGPWGSPAEVHIVHIHACKAHEAVCCMEHMWSAGYVVPDVIVNQPTGNHLTQRQAMYSTVQKECNFTRQIEVLGLIEMAIQSDGGAIYNETASLYAGYLKGTPGET